MCVFMSSPVNFCIGVESECFYNFIPSGNLGLLLTLFLLVLFINILEFQVTDLFLNFFVPLFLFLDSFDFFWIKNIFPLNLLALHVLFV